MYKTALKGLEQAADETELKMLALCDRFIRDFADMPAVVAKFEATKAEILAKRGGRRE